MPFGDVGVIMQKSVYLTASTSTFHKIATHTDFKIKLISTFVQHAQVLKKLFRTGASEKRYMNVYEIRIYSNFFLELTQNSRPTLMLEFKYALLDVPTIRETRVHSV